MDSQKTPFEQPPEAKPAEVLQQLVGIFETKGWLDQTVRIKRRNKRYRILCSGSQFIAYRINDNWGISQGIPGWVVCMINQDQIIEDSQMSTSASDEPGANDWLRCITDGDYETI